MKTSELTDHALDWAVASIEKLPMDLLVWEYGLPVIKRTLFGHTDTLRCEFSTNWSQGGPIIEREFITCGWDWNHEAGHMGFAEKRNSVPPFHSHRHTGPTILIAAMRCYVASRLGNEVNIPEELE